MLFPRKFRSLIAPVAALAVLGSSIGALPASAEQPTLALNPLQKLHPSLQLSDAVSSQSSLPVPVIVQFTTKDVKLDELLRPYPGAQLIEQFQVIPAAVINVPQALLTSLAADPNVRYISPDGAVLVGAVKTGSKPKDDHRPKAPEGYRESKKGLDATHLRTTYPVDTGATSAWNGQGDKNVTGAGIGIAVIDSGIDSTHADFASRVLAVNVNRSSQTAEDGYGHGTHVAGIAAGHATSGEYLGEAPNATLISVKVADDDGVASVSDLLRGMDWVDQNRDAYKVRVVNISVSVSFPESYATSPVDAAVERLWHDNVVVVASAGNLGSSQDAVWYAPGNDPLAITVGCLDEGGTTSVSTESPCPISSRGVTEDGFTKPDLVAPGRKILSTLASGVNGHASGLAAEFPERITSDGKHISLSGTSMAAPVVAGAVALLLERQGGLHPNQVKQILVQTARNYPGQSDSAGALNIAAALVAAQHPPADNAPVLLPLGATSSPQPDHSYLYDGNNWNTTYWDGARWTGAYWDGARWTTTAWDGARWTGSFWDGARWTGASWDGARWTGARWTGARWTGARWTDDSSWD